MSESTVLSQLDVLFKNITEACNEEEKRQIVADLKERYQDSDAHQPDDLKETFHKLYLSGLITHEDLGILYHTAEKSLNKGKIVSHLDEFKRSQPLKSEALVGRSKEKQELLKLLSDDTTHSVNIHGVPGVGKTTLAKHLAKELETITFDLREAKDIDTAYLFILLTLGHTAVSRSYDTWMSFKDFCEREREAILCEIQDKCQKTKQLLLLFDNVQSELFKWRYRNELVCFFNAIIASQECQTGMLKIIVTSRVQIPIQIPIPNYNLDPLPSSTSNNLICRRSKLDLQSEYLQDDEEALSKVADLCRNTPYLLQNAEHVLRNGFITSQELLQKIEAQKDKGVPDEYIITGTSFESLPTDNLKKLAVKLCVYTKPFSLSEVKEVADLKSEYDALLDLEFLTNHGMISKVITEIKTEDGLTQVKTEYEVHSLFKEFAVSYLRVQTPVYQDQAYNEAEVKFGDYFTEKLLKLVSTEAKDPDAVAGVLQHDKYTFDDVLQIRYHNEKILKNLIHFPQQEAICRVTMFLESLKSNERTSIFKLLMTWADALENQGDLDSSASVRCLGILSLIDMEEMAGPRLNQATSALERTEEHINKISAKQLTDGEERNAANLKCLFHFCQGKLNYTKSLRNANKKETFLQLAIEDFEEASKVNKLHANNNYLTVELLKSLSDCQMELSNNSDATDYLKEAINQLKLEQGEIDKPVLISLYNKLALLYGKKNEYSTSKSYLVKALPVHGEHDDAIISNNLGILYQKVWQYSEAISSFREAQSKWEVLGDHDNIAQVCKNFGSLYVEQKEYSLALSYYKRALKLGEKRGHDSNTALVCTNLGGVFMEKKDYDNAISYLNMALEMWKKLDDDNNTALACANLGSVYMEMKDYDRAEDYFKRALEISKKLFDNNNTAKVYRILLNVYMEMKDFDRANAFFKNELDEWKKAGDNRNTANVYKELSNVYMEMKNYVHRKQLEEESKKKGERLQQELQKQEVESHQDQDSTVIVDKRGGTFSLSNIGVTLQIPEGALKQPTNLTVRKVSTDALPSPAGELDSVVSPIIKMEPNNLYLLKPINVTLKHYGPLHTACYENVTMGYDDDDKTNTWEHIKERKDFLASDSSPSNSLEIQLTKLTTVAVVTRLITDTFEVPVSGCKVTSSVSPDVTLEFPPRAVDKLRKGSLKVLPVPPDLLPPDIPKDLAFGPIIMIDGFEKTVFSEEVTITGLYPGAPQSEEQVHLMHYENNEWEDVTDVVKCLNSESTISIKVKQFCGWAACTCLLKTGAEFAKPHAEPYVKKWFKRLCDFLFHPPISAQFLAYRRKNVNPMDGYKITLAMASSCKEVLDQIYKTFDTERYENVAQQSNHDLRHNEVVYASVKGGFETIRETIHRLTFKDDAPHYEELLIREKPRCFSQGELIIEISKRDDPERQAADAVLCELSVTRSQLGLSPLALTQESQVTGEASGVTTNQATNIITTQPIATNQPLEDLEQRPPTS